MARVVDETLHVRRKGRYDWENWLDGRTWLLTEGEDYDKKSNVVAVAHSAGRARNVQVVTRSTADGVLLRAFPRA